MIIDVAIARVPFRGARVISNFYSQPSADVHPIRPDLSALGPAAPSGMKKASIVSGSDSYTFNIIDPETDLSDIAQIDWQEVPHPGQAPWLVNAGRKLRKVALKGKMYRGGAPLTNYIDNLIYMSGLANPITCIYGDAEGGSFRITDLTITTVDREPGTNQVTQFDFTITLTEANDPPVPKPVPTAPAPVPASPPTPAADPPAQPHYVVKKGDTLWQIAVNYYHNGSVWNRIADANGIKDPRKLQVGTNLVIP